MTAYYLCGENVSRAASRRWMTIYHSASECLHVSEKVFRFYASIHFPSLINRQAFPDGKPLAFP